MLPAAAGAISALIFAKILFKKADLTMTLNGALAGLVAITAEPSTPSPLQATIFGGYRRCYRGVIYSCT